MKRAKKKKMTKVKNAGRSYGDDYSYGYDYGYYGYGYNDQYRYNRYNHGYKDRYSSDNSDSGDDFWDPHDSGADPVDQDQAYVDADIFYTGAGIVAVSEAEIDLQSTHDSVAIEQGALELQEIDDADIFSGDANAEREMRRRERDADAEREMRRRAADDGADADQEPGAAPDQETDLATVEAYGAAGPR